MAVAVAVAVQGESHTLLSRVGTHAAVMERGTMRLYQSGDICSLRIKAPGGFGVLPLAMGPGGQETLHLDGA